MNSPDALPAVGRMPEPLARCIPIHQAVDRSIVAVVEAGRSGALVIVYADGDWSEIRAEYECSDGHAWVTSEGHHYAISDTLDADELWKARLITQAQYKFMSEAARVKARQAQLERANRLRAEAASLESSAARVGGA